MGYPMARNLLRAGHDVALWSHRTEKARKLAAAENGRFCETPRQVAAHADCMFLCVGDTEMSREVILGEDAISQDARPGSVVADASTISPSVSRKIARRCEPRVWIFWTLRAPVPPPAPRAGP